MGPAVPHRDRFVVAGREDVVSSAFQAQNRPCVACDGVGERDWLPQVELSYLLVKASCQQDMWFGEVHGQD